MGAFRDTLVALFAPRIEEDLNLRQNRNQFGWIEKHERTGGSSVYVWRFRQKQPDGGWKKKSVLLGTVQTLKTEPADWDKAKAQPEYANSQTQGFVADRVSFGALC